MKKSYLALTFLISVSLFSCNQDLVENEEKISELSENEEKIIETLFNEQLKYTNDQNSEYLLINVGSNFEENLDFYLMAFDINVKVDGSEFQLDEKQKKSLKKSSLKVFDNDEILSEKNNQFEIQFLSSSFNLEDKSISVEVIPQSNINSQLLFPQSLTEITSPNNHKWGRVNRFFIFGNDELNIPDSNPGYFIAYPSRRSCGLCLWTDEWNQTKEFLNVGDQLIFGSDSWVRVRFRIRHDAQNFTVQFKRNGADPW
jgi:hypothetical protein